MEKITDFEIADKEVPELSVRIQNWKQKYFYDLSLKLNNPQTNPKTYWSIINDRKYNDGKNLVIQPFSVDGKIVTKFAEKPILWTNILCPNVMLYQVTVSYQKIKHILQKQNYHLLILRMKICTI